MTDNQNNRSTFSFSRGIAWLVQSMALLRMQAGRLILIAVFMQLILGLTQLPIVGMLIILSVPGLSAGVLQAFDVTARGGIPTLSLLFQPLTTRTHSGRLFLMGALIFAIGVLSISLVLSGNEALLDPDLLSRIEQGDVDAISQLDQEAVGKMILAFLVGISISGTLSYFTIPLIWFGDRKLGAALAEGLRAMVSHWRPFVMLALGLFVVLIPVVIVSGVLFGLASGKGALSVVVLGFMMILILAFQMVLFGTQYCAYRDIFGSEQSSQGPEKPEDENQLLA
ncbi:BPSS1780 family membrane protein [Pseudomonadota bacterium]